MMKRIHLLTRLCLAAGAALLVLTGHLPAVVIYSQTSDGEIRGSGAISTSGTTSRIGYRATGTEGQVVTLFVFQLPTLAANAVFTSAVFSVYSGEVNANMSVNRRADLYGLDYRDNNALLSADYFVGNADANADLIQSSFLVPGATNRFVTVSTDTGGSGNLLTYLNSQAAAARTAGDLSALESNAFVFLRVNSDSYNGNFWVLNTGDQANQNSQPRITFEIGQVPEPGVALLAGLSLAALMLRRRAGRRC